MYCFRVVMWMFKIDWGTTIFSEYVENCPSWWGFLFVNYISVKEALVKSSTWGVGKRHRMGRVKKAWCVQLWSNAMFAAVTAKAFMFANKGFSVQSAVWSGSPSQFTAAPWTCSSHCLWFSISMVCCWHILPTLECSILVLGEVTCSQPAADKCGGHGLDCSDSSAFPDCMRAGWELILPPSTALSWLLEENPLFVYIKGCIFSK